MDTNKTTRLPLWTKLLGLLLLLTATAKADVYHLDSIRNLYIADAPTAWERIDSLGRRLEANGWKGCTRSDYELLCSRICIYMDNEVGCVRHVYRAYDYARKENNTKNRLEALLVMCNVDERMGYESLMRRNGGLMNRIASRSKDYRYFLAIAKLFEAASNKGPRNLKRCLKLLEEADSITRKEATGQMAQHIHTEIGLVRQRFLFEGGEYKRAYEEGQKLIGGLRNAQQNGAGEKKDYVNAMLLVATTGQSRICQRLLKMEEGERYYNEALEMLERYPYVPHQRIYLAHYLAESGRAAEVTGMLSPMLDRKMVSHDARDALELVLRSKMACGDKENMDSLTLRYLNISERLRKRDWAISNQEIDESFRTVTQVEADARVRLERFRNYTYMAVASALILLLLILLYFIIKRYRKRLSDNKYLFERVKESVKQQPLPPKEVPENEKEYLAQVLTDYMKEEERFRDPKFSTSALEKELGVKKYALNLAFQEVTGLSISDTLQQMRLEYARNLVENTDDILEVVATKSGFGSDRTFYRLFRQAYGITPTAYRKMHRIVEDDNS